jgi:hypothetical protein
MLVIYYVDFLQKYTELKTVFHLNSLGFQNFDIVENHMAFQFLWNPYENLVG